MVSISSEQREVILDLLQNILNAITQLQEWNNDLKSVNDLLVSPEGMKTLSADCMLIQAIGEGIKQLDKLTDGQLFPLQPQIPWKQVKGMRDHIAHGYFDINTDLVWSVITEDLAPLKEAIEYFIGIVDQSE